MNKFPVQIPTRIYHYRFHSPASSTKGFVYTKQVALINTVIYLNTKTVWMFSLPFRSFHRRLAHTFGQVYLCALYFNFSAAETAKQLWIHQLFWQIFFCDIFFPPAHLFPFSWKHSTCSGSLNIQAVFHGMFHRNTLYMLIAMIMLESHYPVTQIPIIGHIWCCWALIYADSVGGCYCPLLPPSGQMRQPLRAMKLSKQKTKTQSWIWSYSDERKYIWNIFSYVVC